MSDAALDPAEDERGELLAELRSLTDPIREARGVLDGLYARQTELFRRLREIQTTNRRIAEAAEISEIAVIQRLRGQQKRDAAAREAAKAG